MLEIYSIKIVYRLYFVSEYSWMWRNVKQNETKKKKSDYLGNVKIVER